MFIRDGATRAALRCTATSELCRGDSPGHNIKACLPQRLVGTMPEAYAAKRRRATR